MQKLYALARIAEGVRKFQSEVFPAQREMFERLKRGQEPLAMFVTCADSRVNPNLVTQTDPGEIFIERNPGNIIPPYVEFVGGVTAGVEYAMLVLKVPVIVVCGHTDCGVMNALLHPENVEGMPGVQNVDEPRLSTRADECCRSVASASEDEQDAPYDRVQCSRADREPEDPSQRAGAPASRERSRSGVGFMTSATDRYGKPSL